MAESDTSEVRLEGALKAVMNALPHATPNQRAALFKRAGDICVGLDERRRSLGWYGRAVDQLLQLGQAEEAARLCRLIVHVQPDAVRARGTLTWIAIGNGQHAEAVELLTAYAQAARQAGQGPLTAQQLGWMYEVAASPALRQRLLAEIRSLGDPERADALASRAPAPPLSREQLWARVIDATVGDLAQSARATGR